MSESVRLGEDWGSIRCSHCKEPLPYEYATRCARKNFERQKVGVPGLPLRCPGTEACEERAKVRSRVARMMEGV